MVRIPGLESSQALVEALRATLDSSLGIGAAVAVNFLSVMFQPPTVRILKPGVAIRCMGDNSSTPRTATSR